MHQFIENESLEIYNWFIDNLEYAVEKGWLDASWKKLLVEKNYGEFRA